MLIPPELTLREWKGYLLESAVEATLRYLKVKYESNPLDFKEWKKAQRKGPDQIIFKSGRILNECKNLGRIYFIDPSKFINPSLFKKQFVSRFIKVDPEHECEWVLTVSTPKFGRRVWSIIREYNIRVVTVGFEVTLDNLNRAFDVLMRKFAILLGIRITKEGANGEGLFSLSKLYDGLIDTLGFSPEKYGMKPVKPPPDSSNSIAEHHIGTTALVETNFPKG